ncbi:hypothetical protein OJ998_05030 [Solirubrobacter taibaiensis]|nr:hypothetical protein [Solirubrobacter taibaiensis]
MKAATAFRDELLESLRDLAWTQWSQLGVSGSAPPRREERAVDPEALLLFTFEIGRTDPRLFDEVLDWLALNEPVVSVHRLRNLCVTQTDRALVDAALAWTARARGRGHALQPDDTADELEPLFRQFRTAADAHDPAFAKYGFTRPPLRRSEKSRPPSLQDPIAFALLLRRLLGVGARAEVIRVLLTIRAPRLSSRVISASAGFAQRNVREALAQLLEAGVVSRVDVADERFYTADQTAWAALLGMTAPELPFHEDWIPGLRALTAIGRWVQRPDFDLLSPYIRASQARTLMTEVDANLQYIGLPPQMNTARGADYWDEFTARVRFAVGQIAR